MEWDSEDSLLLIQEYERHRLLWDPKHKDRFNKQKKHDAWREIAKACNTDMDNAKKKMASLLGSFRRERAKGRKIIGTGTAAKEIYKSKWFAFKSLLFLMKRNEAKTTENEYVENGCLDETKNEIMEEESEPLPEDADLSDGELAENSQNTQSDGNKRLQTDNLRNLKQKNSLLKPTVQKRLNTSNSASVVDESYVEAAVKLQQIPDDPNMLYAQYLATKLKQFSGKTRVLVEHAINQTIFEAEMKLYDNSFEPCNLNNSCSDNNK